MRCTEQRMPRPRRRCRASTSVTTLLDGHVTKPSMSVKEGSVSTWCDDAPKCPRWGVLTASTLGEACRCRACCMHMHMHMQGQPRARLTSMMWATLPQAAASLHEMGPSLAAAMPNAGSASRNTERRHSRLCRGSHSLVQRAAVSSSPRLSALLGGTGRCRAQAHESPHTTPQQQNTRAGRVHGTPSRRMQCASANFCLDATPSTLQAVPTNHATTSTAAQLAWHAGRMDARKCARTQHYNCRLAALPQLRLCRCDRPAPGWLLLA
jgi:hypothetical protein